MVLIWLPRKVLGMQVMKMGIILFVISRQFNVAVLNSCCVDLFVVYVVVVRGGPQSAEVGPFPYMTAVQRMKVAAVSGMASFQ